MNTLLRTFTLATLAAAPLIAGAPDETTWPEYDLEVVHPAATSFAAFSGRAVLVEFFAHW